MTITIDNLNVVDNASPGTVIGMLTVTDASGNTIPCNFMLTKGSGGYFAISSNYLTTTFTGSITRGYYPVIVRANGIYTRFKESAIFTITVTVPQSTPTPTGVIFTPSTPSLPDNAAAAGTVAAISVAMSNGSAFAGSLAANPVGTVTVSGNKLVLARALTAADDGSHKWGVVATQNGVAVSGSIPVQVTATPTGVTFTPSTASLPDDAAAGTVVAAVTVATSDGSAFAGSFSASPTGTVTVSGNNLVLARVLTAADDGSHQWGVAATQDGVTVSGSIPIQVTAIPTSVSFSPSTASLPDNAAAASTVAGVSVAMSNGSAFAGSLAANPVGTVTVSGNNLALARALTAADYGPHQWGVAATQNGVTVSGSIPVQVTAASPPPPPPAPPPAPPQAMRAFDFYSKFGANTNINSGNTVSDILAGLAYTGLTAIRDSVFGGSQYPQASVFVPLAAAGVRMHLGYQTGLGVPSYPMATWISELKSNLVTPYPGSVIGVAGPNEPNNQGFTYTDGSGSSGPSDAAVFAANTAQAALYAAMKADPALSAIPVDCWPIGGAYAGNFGSYYADVTGANEQTAYCDRANLHDYYGPDLTNQPTNPGDHTIYDALLDPSFGYLRNIRQMSNHQRFVTTETGWYTPYVSGNPLYASTCDEYTQARLILCDLFDHASLPYCEFVFIFTLLGGSSDLSDPWYGVIHDDGTPKIAGTAIRNLMMILQDSGSNAATFIPGSFAYSLSGMPSASGNFIIAKSNGAFDILLWNETPFWNASTGTQIDIPTSAVTVSLPPGSSGSVYDLINSGTTPIASVSGTSVTVSLNDAPLIIEVTTG